MKNVLITLVVATAATGCALTLVAAAPPPARIVTAPVDAGDDAGRTTDLALTLAGSLFAPEPARALAARRSDRGVRSN